MDQKQKNLDIFQILKNGTNFNSKNDKKVVSTFKEQKDNQQQELLKKRRRRKGSSVDLTNLKFDPSDSESESEQIEKQVETPIQENRPRRKKSLDEIEKKIQVKQSQHQQKINTLKKMNRIKTEGDNVPEPVSNFTKLIKKYKLNQKLVDNITKSGYKKLKPIQMQAIPIQMEKRNLVALAPTGSGKTFAFSLPILHNLGEHSQKKGLRAIIFAPTIELGEQIEREIGFLNYKNELRVKFMHKLNLEIKAFEEQIQDIDVLICTPLKFLKVFKFLLLKKQEKKDLTKEKQQIDEINKKQEKIDELLEKYQKLNNEKKVRILNKKKDSCKKELLDLKKQIKEDLKSQKKNPEQEKVILDNLQYIIFDEVDKYFELDMAHQMKQILELFQDHKNNIQYSLFSATISYPVEELVKNLIDDPIKLTVSGKNNVLNTIDQKLSYCQSEYGKLVELKNIINEGRFTPPVLIFVQSKERGKELLDEMQGMCVNTVLKVDFIHQDKDKVEREKNISDFRTGKLYALICTDLMARGIDFKGVNLVINYDMPQTMITYVHRVGRTGRANRKGTAVTFYTDLDKPVLRELGNMLKSSGCEVPDWILSLQKMNKKDRKHREKFPVKREHISRDPELQKENDPEFDKQIRQANNFYKNEKKRERKLLQKEGVKYADDAQKDEWQVAQPQEDEWQVAGDDDQDQNGEDDDE